MWLERPPKSPHASRFGEGIMKPLTLAAGLLAASAFLSCAYGADDHTGMTTSADSAANSGMVMKMTLPPMPAVYPQAGKPGAPVLTGYGDHHHPITTSDPQSQAYFDQGVRLLFGFNHAEA